METEKMMVRENENRTFIVHAERVRNVAVNLAMVMFLTGLTLALVKL